MLMRGLMRLDEQLHASIDHFIITGFRTFSHMHHYILPFYCITLGILVSYVLDNIYYYQSYAYYAQTVLYYVLAYFIGFLYLWLPSFIQSVFSGVIGKSVKFREDFVCFGGERDFVECVRGILGVF